MELTLLKSRSKETRSGSWEIPLTQLTVIAGLELGPSLSSACNVSVHSPIWMALPHLTSIWEKSSKSHKNSPELSKVIVWPEWEEFFWRLQLQGDAENSVWCSIASAMIGLVGVKCICQTILLLCLSHVFHVSAGSEWSQRQEDGKYKYSKVLYKILAFCEQMASIGTNDILLPVM